MYRAAGASAGSDPRHPDALIVAVAEEFLLLDPRTGQNAPVAGRLCGELADPLRTRSRPGRRHSMVEIVTPACDNLLDLGRHLIAHRRGAAEAAAAAGARLVAVGATPIDDPQWPDPPRSADRALADCYGPIASDPAVCGCHVHVDVPDRELAVQVCNHLRGWLPVVQAITVNSPLHSGADSGHASWRSAQLNRWAGVGPTPLFDSVADYDRTVAALIASGIMRDRSMVPWHARPSATAPTVEIRVGDVCPTVEDTVLVAGLIRALVATALDDIRAGVPAPPVRDCLVSAAHWRAGHDGLTGSLIDLRLGTRRRAWDLVDELFATVSPALLRHGDLHLILAELAQLRREGTGACRQRQVHRRTGSIQAVLADLAERTVAG